MSNIEDIIKENRAYFDKLQPNEDNWTQIEKGLIESKSKNVVFRGHIRRLLTIAASVTLLLSAYLFNVNKANYSFDEISMASPDGRMVNLDPTKNKYTLVQFWESGNMLCSEENCYYYLPAYEKYRDKGFEIYAISLDQEKEAWIEAIADNNLPWIHVSDLMGWNSPVCIECDISKVPTSFLLDQDGQVIVKDIDAQELENTLDKLFAVGE